MLQCKIKYDKVTENGGQFGLEKVVIVPSTKGLRAVLRDMASKHEYASESNVERKEFYLDKTETAKALEKLVANIGDKTVRDAFVETALDALDGKCMFERDTDKASE